MMTDINLREGCNVITSFMINIIYWGITNVYSNTWWWGWELLRSY